MIILDYIQSIPDYKLIVSSVAISISIIILAIIYRTLKNKKEESYVEEAQTEAPMEELPPPPEPEREAETPAEQPKAKSKAKPASRSQIYSKEIKKLKNIRKKLLHRK